MNFLSVLAKANNIQKYFKDDIEKLESAEATVKAALPKDLDLTELLPAVENEIASVLAAKSNGKLNATDALVRVPSASTVGTLAFNLASKIFASFGK